MTTKKKQPHWRDRWRIHPAADLFPMLPEAELRELGEDIRANGLKQEIVLWKDPDVDTSTMTVAERVASMYLLDGRNRLACAG